MHKKLHMRLVNFDVLQESYNLMQKHSIQVSQDDVERVDTLRYMWAKVQEQVNSLQSTLLSVQPQFRATLIENVVAYQTEVTSYVGDYTKVSSGLFFFPFILSCIHLILF